MARIVRDLPFFHPPFEIFQEGFVVFKILAPERGVFDARLGHRAIEVQHPYQARPRSAPVGNRQDRALVEMQAMQNVMGILPDRLGHDQRRFGGDICEDLHPIFLGIDEAVPDLGRKPWARWTFPFSFSRRRDQALFHLELFGFAFLIGGCPQIAAGDEIYCVHKFTDPLGCKT